MTTTEPVQTEPTQAAPETEEAIVAPEKKSFISQQTADIIAGISSLAVGGVTAWRRIKELAHRNTSAIDFIEDIKEKRKEVGPKLAEKIDKGALTSEQAYKELQSAIQWNETAVEERMVAGGAGPIWKKFGLLRSHQKWDVAISTLAAGGIALGSILVLTRGVISDKEEDKPFAKKLAKEASSASENHTLAP